MNMTGVRLVICILVVEGIPLVVAFESRSPIATRQQCDQLNKAKPGYIKGPHQVRADANKESIARKTMFYDNSSPVDKGNSILRVSHLHVIYNHCPQCTYSLWQ